MNITTHGSGLANDGALSVVGTSTQTVGVVNEICDMILASARGTEDDDPAAAQAAE